MESSLIEESKRAKGKNLFGFWRNKKFLYGLAVVVAASFLGYYFIYAGEEPTVTAAPKQWTVKRGDIVTALETDGKVVAEAGVELSFSTSDSSMEVEKVYVKEGDKVKKGDKIASVKTVTLQFELRSAYANYQSALANLKLKQEPATAAEIQKSANAVEQAKINLEQSRLSLEKAKEDAAQSVVAAGRALVTAENNLKMNTTIQTSEIVNDAYESLANTIKSVTITLDSALISADSVVGVDAEFSNDDIEPYLGVLLPNTVPAAQASYETARDATRALQSETATIDSATYATKLLIAERAKQALLSMQGQLNDVRVVLENSITAADFSQTELDALKSKISSARSSVTSSLNSLASARQAITTAENSLENYQMAYDKAREDLAYAELNAERDVVTAEANYTAKKVTLQNAELDYADLIEPPSDTDLASARTSLTNAAISLDKAKYNMEKATLVSPIDGEVVRLNYKEGDIILQDSAEVMAIILNDETLFVEVNIEEADINKLSIGQTAQMTLEAVDGLTIEGEVSFISKTSETDNNGIVTYMVRVLFENTEEGRIKEGMTAAVKFVLSGVENVLSVPVAAVRNVEGAPSVQLENGVWAKVTTGYTDGKYVEIVDGVIEGDKIIY